MKGFSLGWSFAFIISMTFATSLFANENKEKAKAAAEQGRQSFEDMQYLEAAKAFRDAYRLMPTWKLNYNIGQAEAAARRYGLALEAFEQYLALGGDEVPIERKQEVITEVKRLREMVGSVEISAPAGATVLIDGVYRGEAPLSGRLVIAAAIEHIVVVEFDGETLLSRSVRVRGNETITLDAAEQDTSGVADKPSPAMEETLPADKPKQTPETKQNPTKQKRNKLWPVGWIVVGSGAAVLIGGGVTGGMTLSTNQKLVDCKNDPNCNSDESSLNDKQQTLSVLTTTLFAVGGAALATGIVLLIISKKKGEKQTSNQTVVPFASEKAMGATMIWRF